MAAVCCNESVQLLLLRAFVMYLERDGQQRHYQQVLVEVDEPVTIDIEVLHEEVALHDQSRNASTHQHIVM
jgi:hypothetical protein